MTVKKFESEFEIEEKIEVLFPLFSAEGEKLWVPGWSYIPVTGGEKMHEDYMFMTSNHAYATTNAIWLVKKYEPERYFVQFYKVEPEDKIAVITVSCASISSMRSKVTVEYKYVALSDKGRDFIADHGQNDFETFIGQWKTLLETHFGKA